MKSPKALKLKPDGSYSFKLSIAQQRLLLNLLNAGATEVEYKVLSSPRLRKTAYVLRRLWLIVIVEHRHTDPPYFNLRLTNAGLATAIELRRLAKTTQLQLDLQSNPTPPPMTQFSAPQPPELVLPRININGNTRESLVKDYTEALDAQNAASALFLKIDFHGRNYQTLPDGSFEAARKSRNEIFDHLRAIESYLVAHLDAIREPS
jgi:hypothetical protein